MTKKQKYLEPAEKLYVEEQLTLKEITAKLPVSYATLRSWKQEGDWEMKKKQLLLAEGAFHKELYELGRTLARKINESLEAGEEVAAGRFYALGRIMDIVHKTHKYEEKIHEVEKSSGKGKASLKDLVKALNNSLF